MSLSLRSRIRGCLLGGAIGDALGAGIEFSSLAEIRSRHGPHGVTGFVEAYGRLGAFTDDTQMTLFTAAGLTEALRMGTDPVTTTYGAYLAWLDTQGVTGPPPRAAGDLARRSELRHRRAPGATCVSALAAGNMGTPGNRVNGSKGCGAVMRVAPAGFFPTENPFGLGASIAAITHGHPTGFIAAGALATIVAGIAAGEALAEAVTKAGEVAATWDHHDETVAALRQARRLAVRDAPTPETVESLGAGWIAEEALAIGLYCALATPDIRSALLASVNHSGDSDSTGTIAGHILGTLVGEEGLPSDWLTELEARALIVEVADTYGDALEASRGH